MDGFATQDEKRGGADRRAFQPAVSLADAMRGGLPWNDVPVYVGAQLAGAIAGVAATNAMF